LDTINVNIYLNALTEVVLPV